MVSIVDRFSLAKVLLWTNWRVVVQNDKGQEIEFAIEELTEDEVNQIAQLPR